MKSLQIDVITRKIEGYPRASDKLSYLSDNYPIPPYHPDTHALLEGASDAYQLRRTAAADNLPHINLLISPSCTGQDSILDTLPNIGHPVAKVVTATTRPPRVNEEEGAYVWMERHEELDDRETVARLVGRYGLIECQKFGEHFYGTPIQSLREAARNSEGRSIIIKNDQYGAPEITERLNGEFDSRTIAILPETYEQLWSRLVALGRDNPVGRIAEAAVFMSQFEKVTDYALVNREYQDTQKGFECAAHDLSVVLRQHFSSKGGV